MLPKKSRLPIPLFLKKRGKVVKTKFFLVRIFPAEKSFSRFGVIIGKGVLKRAAHRNRQRRRILCFFEKHRDRIETNDFLVTLLPAAGSLPKEAIGRELKKIFHV